MDLGTGNLRPSCEQNEGDGEGNQNAPAGCGGHGVHLDNLASRGPMEQSLFLVVRLENQPRVQVPWLVQGNDVRPGASLRDSLLGLDDQGSTKADIRYLVEVGVRRSRAVYFSRNLKSAMRCGDAQRKFEI